MQLETENRRVLVVDDEVEIREGYKHALNPKRATPLATSHTPGSPPIAEEQPSTRPFEIIEAETGDRALEIFSREFAAGRPFACAIVDVRMPGKLDGLQLIREIWKTDPNVLVVVATAYQDRSVNEIDRLFGSEFQDRWDYLSKPFTTGEITQKARQMVSSWNHQKKIREQQETLIAQERLAAVGRLARSVGHEFGNVLQPLVTKLELAKELVDTSANAKLAAMLDEMLEATMLGSNICQDLLTFSRESTASKNSREEIQTHSIKTTIEKSLRLLNHELKKKDIQTSVKLPESQARYHEARVVQVFINLFTNSIHALKTGGKISVSGEEKEKQIVVRVQDNGSGISQENLKKIFEPLFSTKGENGNGLGLAVSKNIVEEYGGKIAATSEVGKGTTIEIKLPVS